MRFKYSAAVFTIIWSFLLGISHETCWLASQHVPISQAEIPFSANVEFSVHGASGSVLAKQFRERSKETVYYGDFGVLRLYKKDSVTVYQGAYMRLTEPKHQIKPALQANYIQGHVIQLQIIYAYAFGKKQNKDAKYIGVTYFVTSAKKLNKTQRIIGDKFVKQMTQMEKGSLFKIEQYFAPNSQNLAHNLYAYKTVSGQLQVFLPLASQKQVPCQSMLWIVQRDTLQIQMSQLSKLKQHFHISNQKSKDISQYHPRVFAAKLRLNPKTQSSGINQIPVQTVINLSEQKQNQEKQSNSCPQNTQPEQQL